MKLATKRVGDRSTIDRLRTSGAMKLAFPKNRHAVEGIMINTSGGLTGGDRLDVTATAGPQSRLVLSTQAAERGYRSQSGVARVDTKLTVAEEAVLHWLPQELIVFDAASVERRLRVDVAKNSELVLVEPIMFGRKAMNEEVSRGHVKDAISIFRNGKPLFLDRIEFSGAIATELERSSVASGRSAVATAIHVGPRAEGLLHVVRDALPDIGGATLLQPDVLAIRLIADDAFLLRKWLCPVLEILTQSSLPKTWRL
jgi:urease accessory protein